MSFKKKTYLYSFETTNVYLQKMVKNVLFFKNLYVYIAYGTETLLILFHTNIFSVVNTSTWQLNKFGWSTCSSKLTAFHIRKWQKSYSIYMVIYKERWMELTIIFIFSGWKGIISYCGRGILFFSSPVRLSRAKYAHIFRKTRTAWSHSFSKKVIIIMNVMTSHSVLWMV